MITMPKIDWKNVVIFALVIILATLGGYAFEIKEELENSKKILAQSEKNNETIIVVLKKSVIEREEYKQLSGELAKKLDDANELLKKYEHENGKLSKKLRHAKSKTNKLIVAAKKMEREREKIEQEFKLNIELDRLSIKQGTEIIDTLVPQVKKAYTKCKINYTDEVTESFKIAATTGFIDEENKLQIGFNEDAFNNLAVILECKKGKLIVSEYLKDNVSIFNLIRETKVFTKTGLKEPLDQEFIKKLSFDSTLDSDIDEENEDTAPNINNKKTEVSKNPT